MEFHIHRKLRPIHGTVFSPLCARSLNDCPRACTMDTLSHTLSLSSCGFYENQCRLVEVFIVKSTQGFFLRVRSTLVYSFFLTKPYA